MIKVAAMSLIWNQPIGEAFLPWLAEVKSLNYTGVSGFCDTGWKQYITQASWFATVLRDQGLELASIDSGLHRDFGRYRQVCEFMRICGCRHLVTIGNSNHDYSDPGAISDLLNEVGSLTAGYGVFTTYHNSSRERRMTFEEMRTIYDRTDPDKVFVMADTGHATRDMVDLPLPQRAARYLEHYWDRLKLIEFKDYAPETDVNTPVGEGECNYPAVYDLLRRRSYEGWVVVEQNGNLGLSRGRTGGRCARISREHIRAGLGV